MAVAVKEQSTEAGQCLERLVPDSRTREKLIGMGATDVSEMRRYHITRAPGQKSGSAEFFVLFAPNIKVKDIKFISGEDDLKPLAKEIREVDYIVPLPDGSEAKLVRRGILMCTGAHCDFVFIPPDAVFSTK
jgi:hypothetical protein